MIVKRLKKLMHEALQVGWTYEQIHGLAQALHGATPDQIAQANMEFCRDLLNAARGVALIEIERDAHGPAH